MFDTMQIAKRIKAARIDKNMTQLQLADLMGVSYQAVSNWERGNSMPDISKLADLCSALGLTVNELLGMEEKTTAAVTKAMEQEELTVEELQEVAPMMPPQDIMARVEAHTRKIQEQAMQFAEDACKLASEKMGSISDRIGIKVKNASAHANERPKQKKKIDLYAIAELGPFLDEEYLNKLVLDADLNDLDGLDELAPFLSKETLFEIVKRVDISEVDELESVASFMDKDTVAALIKRCIAEGEGDMIGEFASFASKETLDELITALIDQKADFEDLDWDVTELYPFLSKDSLVKLAKYLLDQRQTESISELEDYL